MKIAVKFLLVLSIILVSFFLWLNMGTSSPILWNTGKESVQEQEKKDKEKAKDKEQTVHITRQDGTSLKLPLETYLEGVIGSEMPASFEMEALKAQCVAARTFVTKRGFEVDDTTRTQVYHDDKQMRQIWGSSYDKMHARVVKALQETEGEIMTYQGEPISAVFFSGSCGKQPTVRNTGTAGRRICAVWIHIGIKRKTAMKKQLLFQRRIFIRCSALRIR